MKFERPGIESLYENIFSVKKELTLKHVKEVAFKHSRATVKPTMKGKTIEGDTSQIPIVLSLALY